MLHRGSASLSRLVRDLRSADRGFAVDGRVLDSPVRHFGRTWVRGLSGQRPAHQESTGAKERCAGKPVAAETAHLRIVEQLVSTSFGNSGSAYLLAAAATTRHWGGDLCSTNAESTDADEHSVSECNQRSERSERTDDHAGHRSGGTRPTKGRRT